MDSAGENGGLLLFIVTMKSQPSHGQMRDSSPTGNICFGTPPLPVPWDQDAEVKARPCSFLLKEMVSCQALLP